MSKNLLHKNKLTKFIEWLDKNNIPNREGRGGYELRQICIDTKNWFCIFDRNDVKEHYTVDRRLVATVYKFIRDKKTHSHPT